MSRAIRAATVVLVALGLAAGVAGVARAQDGDMPPGHPAVADGNDDPHDGPKGDDARDDDARGDDPHGGDPHGQNPHGQNPHGGGEGAERIFNAPPDGSQDDPALKPGTLVITIRDAADKPIPHAPVVVDVLHSTVAKGDSREHLKKETDDAGELHFESLQVGAGTSYRVSTKRGDATFAAPPFALTDKAGKRAVLHAYDGTTNIDDLLLLTQVVTYCALREDSIQIEQLVTVYNVSPKAWIADAKVDLPPHFKAFNKQDSTEEGRIDEIDGVGYALRGTFAPGRHDIDIRYQVPLDATEQQTLRIGTPPHTADARVMVEAGRTMTIEVANFPPAQRTPMNGKRVLVTQRSATRGEGGVSTIDVTINGLPTPGPGRWVAVALAGLAILGGIWTILTRDRSADEPEARRDLEEARDTLLEELVTLEKLHQGGEIGPKTYARVRASLLDALARIVDQLAKNPPPKKKKASPRAARGAA